MWHFYVFHVTLVQQHPALLKTQLCPVQTVMAVFMLITGWDNEAHCFSTRTHLHLNVFSTCRAYQAQRPLENRSSISCHDVLSWGGGGGGHPVLHKSPQNYLALFPICGISPLIFWLCILTAQDRVKTPCKDSVRGLLNPDLFFRLSSETNR